MKRDKEGHYIMIKGSIQEEDITIINIYASNIGAPQYVVSFVSFHGLYFKVFLSDMSVATPAFFWSPFA